MYTSFTRRRTSVTPCVGVWIETHGWQTVPIYVPSHPAWVCGLKHVLGAENIENLLSHPAWVCGLKLNRIVKTDCASSSHPAWVCGLKRCGSRIIRNHVCVTPCVGVWIETERNVRHKTKLSRVTPCVGVWIETTMTAQFKGQGKSHPAWVCGLKLVLCNI